MYYIEQLENIIRDKKLRIILVCSFVSGILAHGMAVFSKYAFHDELGSMFGYYIGATYRSGRWAAELLEYFYRWIYGGYNYSVSTFHFLFAIICSSLMIWLIVKILNIKNIVAIGLLSILNVVYPVFTSMMGYTFTIPFTYLGYFLGTVSVYLLLNKTNIVKIILGLILGIFSLALYQAVLPMMLTLIVLKMMVNTFEDKYQKCKEFILDILKSITYCLAIVISYIISVRVSLVIHAAKLNNYRDIDTFGTTSIRGYLERIVIAYKYFILPRGASADVFPNTILFLRYVIVVSSFVLLIIIAYNLAKSGKVYAIIELLILTITFPLVYDFIFVMVDLSYVHTLMLYSQFLLYVLLIVMIEKADEFIPKYIGVIEILTVMVLSIISLLYIRYDNICYTKTEFALEEAKAYLIELKTRIESVDGYAADKQVLFLNETDKNIDNLYHMDEFNSITISPYVNLYGGNYVSDTKWKMFMLYWTGYDPILYEGKELLEDERLKALPRYPDDGSISIIDDVIVVNF